MNLKILIVLINLLLTTSCSSASWKHAGVSPEKRTWRFCSQLRDGTKAGKGFCYIDLECKESFLKKKCRSVPLFCAWTDDACKKKYKIDQMIIKMRED